MGDEESIDLVKRVQTMLRVNGIIYKVNYGTKFHQVRDLQLVLYFVSGCIDKL